MFLKKWKKIRTIFFWSWVFLVVLVFLFHCLCVSEWGFSFPQFRSLKCGWTQPLINFFRFKFVSLEVLNYSADELTWDKEIFSLQTIGGNSSVEWWNHQIILVSFGRSHFSLRREVIECKLTPFIKFKHSRCLKNRGNYWINGKPNLNNGKIKRQKKM